MTDAAPYVRGALFDLCVGTFTDLTDPVAVVYGTPGGGSALPADIVGVFAAESSEDYAVMSTTRNSEQTLEYTVTISCGRGGGGSVVQRATYDRAYELLELLRAALAAHPHLDLPPQSCRDARITSVTAVEPDSASATTSGRYTELYVTVTTRARIVEGAPAPNVYDSSETYDG